MKEKSKIQGQTMRILFGKMALLAAVMLLAVAPGLAKDKAPKPKVVTLQNAQGQSIGTATLSPAKNGVSIKLNLHDLEPVDHGIHIHQTAKCEGPDFKSAGGHFNPDAKHHGLQNPEGHHAGDMPNFTVKADGTAKTTVTDKNVKMDDSDHSVYTGGGTA